MIVPNKFISLDQSLISKLPHMLIGLADAKSVLKFFEENHKTFEDVGEFLLALDVLFVLGRVDFDQETGTLYLC